MKTIEAENTMTTSEIKADHKTSGQKRMETLDAEYKKGQNAIASLQEQIKTIAIQMNRIQGAYAILKEQESEPIEVTMDKLADESISAE